MNEVFVTLDFSPEEYDILQKKASQVGVEISTYIKGEILDEVYLNIQLEKLLSFVEKLPVDTKFNIKTLFGANWEEFDRTTRHKLGKRFVAEVTQGFVENVEALGRNPSNVMEYLKKDNIKLEKEVLEEPVEELEELVVERAAITSSIITESESTVDTSKVVTEEKVEEVGTKVVEEQNQEINTGDKKRKEILDFLHLHVFDPVLDSKTATSELKRGIQLTINRISGKSAEEIIQYVWSALGDDQARRFATQLKAQGFTRFEDLIEALNEKFGDAWIRS